MNIADHFGLLVREIEPTVDRLAPLKFQAGDINSFPSEGTRECYLTRGQATSVLLLQPHGSPGPYHRAMERRGPGLHHIAIHVPDPAGFVRGADGWMMHRLSVDSWPNAKTIWLCHPTVPFLVEVVQGEGQPSDSSVALQTPGCSDRMGAMRLDNVEPGSVASLLVGHHAMPIHELCC